MCLAARLCTAVRSCWARLTEECSSMSMVPLPCGAQVAQKGARALVKFYTDLQASVADVRSWYGVGLEPIIALVRCPTLRMPLVACTPAAL